jgi:HAD superfamily hydrolase (TIGR01509 family)
MTVKAVVFDLDGTIASFNVDYMSIRAEVRGLLISVGLPASVLSLNESIFEMLKKAEIFMKNNGKPEKAVEDMRGKALAIAEKYELEAAKNTSLLPGVAETLKAVKKMDLKIGLCTINSEKSTDYILKRFKIAGFFDAIVTRNKVRYVKPNTEHLETVLKALGVNAGETVVVGDSAGDVKCARESKAIAVGLPTGFSPKEKLIDSGANYLITSMTDLPMLIEQLRRG